MFIYNIVSNMYHLLKSSNLQKHPECKKYEDNQKQHCKQVGASKIFDISLGQEVTLSKYFNSLAIVVNNLC